MRISIIVPTVNRLNDIKTFIRSLEKQTLPPFELIIVDQSDDNAVKDYAVQYASHTVFPVKYLRTNIKSLTRARNLGIENISSESDLVGLYDDDMALHDTYLKETAKFMARDKDKCYGVAVGNIIKEQYSVDGIGAIYNNVLIFLQKFFLLPAQGNGKFRINGMPTFYSINPTENPIDVEVISGGVATFRKELFDEYRFDGNMRSYCYMEDDDIGYRISRKYRIVYIPSAKAYHNESPMNRMKISDNRSMFIQNYIYLFRKNIPKTPLSISALIWSIIGLFITAIYCRNLSAIKGYFKGLIKALNGNYDSLFPDWREKIHLYRN